MAYFFHEKRDIYFEHQRLTTQNFIIPFIEQKRNLESGMKVLEIGCAEGGVLKAFVERNCRATGVDLNASRLELAKTFLRDELEAARVTLINENIYADSFKKRFKGQFDLIVLKDVIEHIDDQPKLLSYLHTFLREGGLIFFAFPPWHMPFGGHQQVCRNKWASRLPYYHLLPKPVYKTVLKGFGESTAKIDALLEIKRLGLSIEAFERMLRSNGYRTLAKKHFLFNPIYEYKFKIHTREQFKWLQKLPFLRNFVTTAVYYLVEPAT